MDTVAVSLGGSFLVKPDGVDVALTRDLAGVLRRAAAARRVLAVVGGGATARAYIQGARTLGAGETALDDVGIAVTRLNARVLLAALPEAFPVPPDTIDDALLAAAGHPIVVMGGTHAGHTTDAVSIMLADKAGAGRVVIATNVDGVYSADPRKDKDAKRMPRLTHADLVRITSGGDGRAGGTGVVDALGARMLARAGLECAVVDGRDLKALEAALSGATDFDGSLVTTEA